MIQGIYSGASGLKAQQKRLDVLANNIANADTIGFKSSRVDFQDALYQTMANPQPAEEGGNLQKGHGVHVSQTVRAFSQGMVQQTDRALDMMLTSQGYFTLQSPQGQVSFTRNGAFDLSVEDDAQYLVTGDGHYVLGTDGQRIQVPQGELHISPTGALRIGDQPPFAQLMVARFDNQEGLEAVGGNRLIPTDASGQPQPVLQPDVLQGALEASNVDLAQEMTRLIRTQRAFTLSSRAVQVADEMEGLSNTLRR